MITRSPFTRDSGFNPRLSDDTPEQYINRFRERHSPYRRAISAPFVVDPEDSAGSLDHRYRMELLEEYKSLLPAPEVVQADSPLDRDVGHDVYTILNERVAENGGRLEQIQFPRDVTKLQFNRHARVIVPLTVRVLGMDFDLNTDNPFLGTGSFGAVLDYGPIALKFAWFHTESTYSTTIERRLVMENEARAIEQLYGCEYITDFYGSVWYGSGDLTVFALAMRKEDGTLNSKLAGMLTYTEMSRTMRQLTDAMRCFSERGFVFNDLKPDNVLIRNNPDGTFDIRIGDMGCVVEAGEKPLCGARQVSYKPRRDKNFRATVGEDGLGLAYVLLSLWLYTRVSERDVVDGWFAVEDAHTYQTVDTSIDRLARTIMRTPEFRETPREIADKMITYIVKACLRVTPEILLEEPFLQEDLVQEIEDRAIAERRATALAQSRIVREPSQVRFRMASYDNVPGVDYGWDSFSG